MKSPKTPHLAWRLISEKAFIINTETSVLHELDETGTFIWKLLDKTADPAIIAGLLCEQYEVSPEQAKKDTTKFLKELRVNGLIE